MVEDPVVQVQTTRNGLAQNNFSYAVHRRVRMILKLFFAIALVSLVSKYKQGKQEPQLNQKMIITRELKKKKKCSQKKREERCRYDFSCRWSPQLGCIPQQTTAPNTSEKEEKAPVPASSPEAINCTQYENLISCRINQCAWSPVTDECFSVPVLKTPSTEGKEIEVEVASAPTSSPEAIDCTQCNNRVDCRMNSCLWFKPWGCFNWPIP